MTSKRPYRDALPIERVKEEFIKGMGTQWDPSITDIFLRLLDQHFSEIQEIMEKYD